ncbi:restriction endonuclease [Myroides albus]|uniref:restriction endonuclease n=1 Tax=Myroides albus TaxID=2562892 RepID=UPI002159044E|nr:restriction endonuclease [Myroides albus]UVD80067.1 restriction endonuclease [Myroides albus]
MNIDWNKISPERFEQLCTEIIRNEGFYNIRRMGGSGDRGRDIIAQKQTQLFFGSNEIQNWIIQCKRLVKSNLTIDDLSSELNKVRMHKVDYYLLILSNTLKSNLVDWIDGVRKDYSFKILINDIDWLENQLRREPSLYKYYFENISRNEVIYSIKNNTQLQIYTAGKMPSNAIRGEITEWRNNLEIGSSILGSKFGFYHPEFAGCDHTGIYLSETVQSDFRMIAQSDILIAYLEDNEQFGTITEIMIAYSMNKQIAIFIDEKIKTNISVPEMEDENNVSLEYYKEVYNKVFKTNHSCPCDLMNDLKPIHLNNYWFMIEFLLLRQPDTFIRMTTKNKLNSDIIKYLKEFDK